MPPQFRMYIVRHGETEWNRTRKIQGQLDIPLNETGTKQATLVAEKLKNVPFVKAFSSDLQRATKTAECILRYHPNTVLELDESIRERVSRVPSATPTRDELIFVNNYHDYQYMGELQGEVRRSNKPAPSLETTSNFVARCLAWYSGSIVNYMISTLNAGLPMKQPHNILVVSHGAWIAVLLAALRVNGLLVGHEGAEIGHCLNTGVSIIEYTNIPTRRDEVLVGTLVQYSDAEHLLYEGLRHQEVNADVLEDKVTNK